MMTGGGRVGVGGGVDVGVGVTQTGAKSGPLMMTTSLPIKVNTETTMGVPGVTVYGAVGSPFTDMEMMPAEPSVVMVTTICCPEASHTAV